MAREGREGSKVTVEVRVEAGPIPMEAKGSHTCLRSGPDLDKCLLSEYMNNQVSDLPCTSLPLFAASS